MLLPRLKRGATPAYDTIDAERTPVIICGFGRFGQIVGRVLRMHGIAFTALERDPGQVEVVRRFGKQGLFRRSDAARRAARRRRRAGEAAGGGAGRSAEARCAVEMAKRNFPNLAILARARNRRHAHLLMDREVDGLVRDTFHSSLQLAELALTRLGIDAERRRRSGRWRCSATTTRGRCVEAHAIYRDEQQLIQSTQQAAEELAVCSRPIAPRRSRTPTPAPGGGQAMLPCVMPVKPSSWMWVLSASVIVVLPLVDWASARAVAAASAP